MVTGARDTCERTRRRRAAFAAVRRRRRHVVVRRLRGPDDHGRFRTHDRDSVARPLRRHLTRVTQGAVAVDDLRRRQTVALKQQLLLASGGVMLCARSACAARARAGAPRRQTSAQTNRRDADEAAKARRRRQRAARKYQPDQIKLLLVAEAPPAALDRYFYFEDVATQDSLFRYLARSILKVEPTRGSKRQLLGQLRDRGAFLIDLKPDPVDGDPLETQVPALVRRIRALDPEKIIVIKSSVFDLVSEAIADAKLPLVDERVPFPGSGQQRRFEDAFARALTRRPRPR